MHPIIADSDGKNRFTVEYGNSVFDVTLKFLRTHMVKDDGYDGKTHSKTIALHFHGRPTNHHLAKQVLSALFSYSYCSHSWDCCGCAFYKAYEHQMVRIKRHEYRILAHTMYNV